MATSALKFIEWHLNTMWRAILCVMFSVAVLANANAGSWTPTDASGAGLAFTAVSAHYDYDREGNVVAAYFALTYPSTANTSNTSIGGLAIGIPNFAYAYSPSPCYATGAGVAATIARTNPNTTTLGFYRAGLGTALKNSDVSGQTIQCKVVYPATGLASASIMDYGADPTGAISSETAFNACIASGSDCYIPAGTYQIACGGHTAASGITIFGDGWKQSILKLPPLCTLGTSAVIASANVRDLTVDANNAAVTSTVSIISLPAGDSPFVQRAHVIDGSTGMFLIVVGDTTTNPTISDNYLQLAAPSTTANRCILFTNAGGGTITGGRVSNNVCVNSGMWFEAIGLEIVSNDITGWNYGPGIGAGQSANSKNYSIRGNRLHNSGTALDVDNTPAVGVENWGPYSVIQNNACWALGGGCIDQGGKDSLITGNWAYGINKHGYPTSAAFANRYSDSTYNGSGSHWSGNWAADDGDGHTTYGYNEQSNLIANSTLTGNNFSGVASGGSRTNILSATTTTDPMTLTGYSSGTALMMTQVASVSSSLDFVKIDTTDFKSFRLSCTGVQLSTGAGSDIGIQVGEGSTPTWEVGAAYSVSLLGLQRGSSTPITRNIVATGTYMPINGSAIFANSAILSHFTVEFGSISDSGLYKQVSSEAVYPISGGLESVRGGGNYTGDTNAWTSIRVLPSSGTIARGTCKLYGYM